MTDFADCVEQVWVLFFWDGPQVEEDQALLDLRDDRRIALPQGLGQRRF